MPKKGKGTTTKAKSAEGSAQQQGEAQHKPVVLEDDSEQYVTLKLKLLNWSYMNFDMRAKTSMHLFTLRRAVQERHAGVTDLVMCKDAFQVANEMKDETLTLADYGVHGAPKNQDPPVIVNIFYDFKPLVQEPLLLES